MNTKYTNRSEYPKKTGMLLSVIIPAHNAEKTLRRAVESALGAMCVIEGNETLRAGRPGASGQESSKSSLYEILIIENGSSDGTEAMARGLQAEYPGSVRVLQSEKGVSNARNKGLDEAGGEWILFLDADDYYLEDAGAVLRDDMFFSGTDLIVHSYESGKKLIHVCQPGGERYSGDISGISVRMIENPTRYTTVWSKLFRKDRIEYGRLRFEPSLRLSEDSHFFIRYLSLCRRIRLIDRAFYHYSTDNESAVRTWDGKKEEGYRKSLEAVHAFLKTRPEPVREAFAGYGMMQFNLLMVREVFAAGPGSAPGTDSASGRDSGTGTFTPVQKIREMIRISREEPFAAAIQGYDSGRHKGVRYLPIRLLKSGLPLGAAAIYEARVLQNRRSERMH